MQTWVKLGTDSIYKVLDSAEQRKEGPEGVGQWADLEEGAGFQLGREGWIIEFKKEREGKIQPAQFHLSRDRGPTQLESLILK